MISTKKLFEIVELNDDATLSNIISKKKYKINEYVKNVGIIQHAVIHRSKECFDLLLNKNIGINDIIYYNALNVSIKYLTSPNPTNKYYFDKLIQFGVRIDKDIVDRNNNSIFLDILYENLLIREDNIDYNIICCYIDNPDKFYVLFDKYEKTENNIRTLLIHAVKTNNLDFIKSIYTYIENNLPDFYTNNQIIIYAIEMNSEKLDIIKYIMTKPVNWYYMHNMVTTLQYTLYYSNDNIFNYFYDLHKNLDIETLNSINKIKLIKYDYMSYMNVHSINSDKIKRYKLILNLPIEFDKDNMFIMVQTIIEFILIYSNSDYKYLFEFIEYLLDYIKPSQRIILSSNSLQEEFINKHDRTYNKFSNIINDYYTKHYKSNKSKLKLDKIHNMILYLMDVRKESDFNEYELQFLKDVKYTFECSNTILNNNDYDNSKIRYLQEFSENMKILSNIFKIYNFVIKELENYIITKSI